MVREKGNIIFKSKKGRDGNLGGGGRQDMEKRMENRERTGNKVTNSRRTEL